MKKGQKGSWLRLTFNKVYPCLKLGEAWRVKASFALGWVPQPAMLTAVWPSLAPPRVTPA